MAVHTPIHGDAALHRRVLDLTRDLVAERGADLTLDEVAGRAGVSRDALAGDFGSRTELFRALIDHLDESLQSGALLQRACAAPDGATLLERIVRADATFWATVAPLARVLTDGDVDQALAALWHGRMEERRAHLRRAIEELHGRGELHDTWSIDEAADLLHAVADLDTWSVLTAHGAEDDAGYVRSLTEGLVRALLRRRDGPRMGSADPR